MRKSAMLTILMLLIASVGYSQMADLKDAIIEKETSMYEALKSGDMETFEGNLAENFYSVSAEGIVNRAKEIANMTKLKMESYGLSNFKVMQAAEGIVLVHYKSTVSGVYNDKPFDSNYYNTSAWAEMEDGSWKAIMHTSVQATPMEKTMGMEQEE